MKQVYYRPGEPTPEEMSGYIKKFGKEKIGDYLRNVNIGDLGVFPFVAVGSLLLKVGAYAVAGYYVGDFLSLWGGGTEESSPTSKLKEKIVSSLPWFASATGLALLSRLKEGKIRTYGQIASMGLAGVGVVKLVIPSKATELAPIIIPNSKITMDDKIRPTVNGNFNDYSQGYLKRTGLIISYGIYSNVDSPIDVVSRLLMTKVNTLIQKPISQSFVSERKGTLIPNETFESTLPGVYMYRGEAEANTDFVFNLLVYKSDNLNNPISVSEPLRFPYTELKSKLY